jgi:predicted nuclease of predicted toxin-antitoxin system
MFLANENFPLPGIHLLRKHGYEVVSIQEENPSITDMQVIEIAIASNLIILTFDKDYGELIFRYSKENPPAVIFFREKGNTPLAAAQLLIKLLEEGHIVFNNTFSVIEGNNIRQRIYKKGQ